MVQNNDTTHPTMLGSLLTVWVLVGLFFYLNHYTRRRYFTIWAVAWLFYALWLTLLLNSPLSATGSLYFIFQQLAVACSAVFLFWGSVSCLNLQVRDRLIALFLVFVVLWSYVGGWYLERQIFVQLPIFGLTALASMFVGCAFLRFRRRRGFIGAGLLSIGFLFWGVFLASFPLAQQFRHWVSTAFLVSAGLQLFIAVSMIVLVLEEVRENANQMQKELDSIKAEKRSLQMKMLSTEQDSALLAEKSLPEDLQAAYAELRRTQHTVVQQERLRALGQMASGIAHDINNALCPVLTFSDMLLTEPNLSPDSRKRLRHIRTAGDDIARLVARMRDFYRRRTSHDELAPVNVPDVVEQVVELTRPRWRDMAQRNGVTIHLETSLDSNLPVLQSQEMELREALTNLVLNSVEAMPTGGTITISARIKDGLLAKDGAAQPRLVLEVADTGSGMAEDVRKRCLEPFFSTKEQRGGSGLGLAMVYGIVQRHDAKIEIDSEEGKGTRIRLCFPINAAQPVTPVVPQTTTKFQPLRILCIDDEPVLREMLEQVLQVSGHQVSVAADGKEGVTTFNREQTGQHPFDVVITDLGMPVMDGLDVARHIRACSPRTPIVLLTGWGTLLGDDATEASAFDAILSKPTRVPELMSALAKATSRFSRSPMGALAN
jgi:signal transduction histidine kinase/ActR/RegA family two-component response regulator